MSAKLVALIDGSIYARSVCEHAGWIAGRTGMAVELLHVLGRRETASAADLSGSIALGARTALLEELSALDEQRAKLAQKRGRAILEDAQAVLAEAGVERISAKLRLGDLVETAAESERDAELLVIGKRGEAADFAKLHLGSNMERIVRSSTKPVFVTARAFKPIKRLLVAFDGGASSFKAVEHVARYPLFAGLDCHILTVGEKTPEVLRKLDEAVNALAAGGRAVTAGVVAGQPEKRIAETVETSGIDLLVMGAYGHSRIRSFIIGSTTTEMIRSCKIPILLFR